MAAEPEGPMPPMQAADYSFHVMFEKSNLDVDYRGARARMHRAAQDADNDLVLIASDQRFKA